MLTNQAAQRLIMEGVTSLQQGRPAEARERFQEIAQTGRANSQIWLLLATSCRALGDLEGEEAALDSLLAGPVDRARADHEGRLSPSMRR
jgi:thioredoxin-like negative regulator of GroEL